ncbi:MAG: cyclophilin-like fold protein [Gemmatimonadota bacterium]|nr:cyclophilin-like fold protein [Gemmatimonadota bacterium]
MSAITITVNHISLSADLNESPTAQQILDNLPIEFSGSLWGEEIYGSIPVDAASEADARADVEIGTLAYWPPSSAFCIFYGPTPASNCDQPRAASPVNIVGCITDDTTVLRHITSGPQVRLDKKV